MQFYCLARLEVSGYSTIIPFGKEYQWWDSKHNHNLLRISRILRSMRYMGHENLSLQLYTCLKCLDLHNVSEETWKFWEYATFGDINKERL